MKTKHILPFLAMLYAIMMMSCGTSISGHRQVKSKTSDSSTVVMTAWDSMTAEFDTVHAMYDIFIEELTADEKDEFFHENKVGTSIFYEGFSQISFDGWIGRRVFVTNDPDYYCVEQSPVGGHFSCKLYKAREIGDHVLVDSLVIENPLELHASLDPVRAAIGRAYLSLHQYRESRDGDRRSRMLKMTSAVK